MRFKVGDKVRNKAGFPWETGTVVGLRTPDTIEVLPDNGYRFGEGRARTPGAGSYSLRQLEAVEPEKVESAKFKIGDRVKVVGYPPTEIAARTGDVGVVVGHGSAHPYKVRLDRTGEWQLFLEGESQYVPSRDFKLRHNDRIRNNRTGRLGHVVTGQDDRLWVVDDSYSEETGAPASAVEEYEEHYAGTYEITNRGPF